MRIKKYCITLILLLFGVGIAHSQERHTEICIDFRVNSTVIDSAYSDNAARMQEMLEFLRTIRQDSTINIIEVSFCGAASPEGSYQLNRKLAQGRLSALEKFIRSEVDIPDSLITYNDSYIPWDYLKSQIEDSGLIRKDEVIAGKSSVAAEIDLAKHWSFTLPVYYSAWDYFKTTIKFRTFSVQPEFRYWLSENNDGFFAGAHFGLAYYNFAFDGDYRYQDHNRETPSIGGGLSVGYRLPISRNNRWWVEFSLGAGVYSNHYDKFHNTPRTKDGLMIESIKKTYWGIDQAAVSFSYSFDLKKKGGKR